MKDTTSKAELEQRLLRIQRELEATLVALQRATDDGPELKSTPPSRPARRPVREILIESLDDLGWPAYARELGLYASARYGRQVEPTRFGALAADERNSYYHGRTRPVWLCHGLTFDRGEAIRRLWARSDWPLATRVVAPTTGRVQHLRLTARLCQLAGEHEGQPDRLHYLAADFARDLPDTTVRRGDFALDDWRATAEQTLARVEDDDAQRRQEAAVRLEASLPEAHLLFGAPEVLQGKDGVPARREATR